MSLFYLLLSKRSTPGTHHHCPHMYVPVRLQSFIEGLCLRNILIKITYTTVNKTSIQVVVCLPTRCLYTALHGRNISNLLPGKALSFPRYCSFFLFGKNYISSSSPVLKPRAKCTTHSQQLTFISFL